MLFTFPFFEIHALLTTFFFLDLKAFMMPVKKCPICHSDSTIQETKPVPSEGFYSKIYKCEQGHVYRVKISYKGIKRTTVKILKGEKDEGD
jgi:hypothetical protein